MDAPSRARLALVLGCWHRNQAIRGGIEQWSGPEIAKRRLRDCGGEGIQVLAVRASRTLLACLC